MRAPRAERAAGGFVPGQAVPRLLIVDDEPGIRRILGSLLRSSGHDVVEASGLTRARAELAGGLFDLVLTDQKMPDGDGLAIIAACQEADPTLPVVLLTAFGTVELAVEAMRLGAFDVLTKPFQPEQVEAVVRRATERTALLRENALLREELHRRKGDHGLIGESPAMLALKEMIGRVGPTHATVLITGETGTGKELVARALHASSLRAEQPFIEVNCAAFTETLLDSQLFGHERGAFTGADRSRQGVFEAAHRGTLFLDEAGEMSLPLQAKLLRVLVNGDVVRVGSTTPRKVDVRILVATHRDLLDRVKQGLFREDLYYRLAVVPIHVPPLRERRLDVPALAEHLLGEVASDLKMQPRRLTPAALEKLSGYSFPGNVRELRNLIERASILARREAIGPADLPDLAREDGAGVPEAADIESCLAALGERLDLRDTLAEVERRLVSRVLASAGGVQAEAARRLGLSRSDFSYKLRRLGLTPARDDGV